MPAPAGTQQAYEEMEQTVYNSLSTLVKDTGVLRDYTALSLQILQVRLASAGP
jgi:hypothetical protein